MMLYRRRTMKPAKSRAAADAATSVTRNHTSTTTMLCISDFVSDPRHIFKPAQHMKRARLQPRIDQVNELRAGLVNGLSAGSEIRWRK